MKRQRGFYYPILSNLKLAINVYRVLLRSVETAYRKRYFMVITHS